MKKLLEGKTALIAGGAGEVGEGIVRIFLDQGATVIVPSRSAQKLQQLRDRLGSDATSGLVTIRGNVGTQTGAEGIRTKIRQKFHSFDCVVDSLGGWWQGERLTELPFETWENLVNSNLNSHFLLARTFLPMVAGRETGSYILMNGGACEKPYPNSGPVSIMAAAQIMLKDVLVKEQNSDNVRINSLLIYTPVKTRSRPDGQPEWLTAEDIGRYTAYLASDAARAIHGQSIRFKDRSEIPNSGTSSSP